MIMDQLIFHQTPQDVLIEKTAERVFELISCKFDIPKKHKSDENDLLTRKEAMSLLKMSNTTFWKNEREGSIKSVGIGGKKYYRKNDLLESLIQKK